LSQYILKGPTGDKA